MQRRRADEAVAELREDRCEPLQNLARLCARWADDFSEIVRDYDPDMDSLINRVADNWRPLFAIADTIGSDWPARAREAAETLAPREIESTGPMLLADMRVVFDEKDTDRLSSNDACKALNEIEGRPWADWKGKGLTPNQLARLLKPFSVRSDNVRKQAGLNRVEIRDSHGNTIVFPLSGDPAPAVGNDKNAVDHRREIVL